MKTQLSRLSTVLITVILMSNLSHAKTWRVNSQSNYNNTSQWGENYGGTPTYPVFKQINEAIANANVLAEDTLHIEGSSIFILRQLSLSA